MCKLLHIGSSRIHWPPHSFPFPECFCHPRQGATRAPIAHLAVGQGRRIRTQSSRAAFVAPSSSSAVARASRPTLPSSRQPRIHSCSFIHSAHWVPRSSRPLARAGQFLHPALGALVSGHDPSECVRTTCLRQWTRDHENPSAAGAES